MKSKINLKSLKVKSFVTEVKDDIKVNGGVSLVSTLNIMASQCRNHCPVH